MSYSDRWISVRCVFEVAPADLRPGDPRTYEERVTLWHATDFDAAIGLAETDSERYAESIGARYLGLAQAYLMNDKPRHGAEVYSLMRDSHLPPTEYLDTYFSGGSEREHR